MSFLFTVKKFNHCFGAFGLTHFSPACSSSFNLWMVCTYSLPYTAHLEKIMLCFTIHIQLSNHLKDLTPSLAWELVFATKTTYQQKRKSHHSHPSSAKVSAIWVSTFCTLGNLEFPSVGRKICQLKHHDAGKKLEIAHKKTINEFIR